MKSYNVMTPQVTYSMVGHPGTNGQGKEESSIQSSLQFLGN